MAAGDILFLFFDCKDCLSFVVLIAAGLLPATADKEVMLTTVLVTIVVVFSIVD
jgi:hypothetical protein